MNPRPEVEEYGKAVRRAAAVVGWLEGPTPRWGPVLVVGALIVAFTLKSCGGSDHTAERWSRLYGRQESTLYQELVNPNCTNWWEAASSACSDAPRALAKYPDWNQPHVSVYSFASAPPPPPTLHDPSDRGQEETGLPAKIKADGGGSLTQTRDAPSDPGADSGDPFHFRRVLVATVVKGANWKPGERMMWTRVFVQPINFTFAGYTVASTKNASVNVTSVETTNSRKISAAFDAAIPGGLKAGLDPENEHSVKTTSDIRVQYENLGVDIMPKFLRIIRESERGADVEGNALVSLSVVTDPLTIQKRSPKEDPATKDPLGDDVVLLVNETHLDGDAASPARRGEHDPATAPWISVLPQVPVPHCPLRARVWMLYEERKIDDTRGSYDESKNDVTLWDDAEDKQDVDIMSADEVSPALWYIVLCEKEKCDLKNGRHLQAHVKDGLPRNVVFTDYKAAVALTRWLRTTQKSSVATTSRADNPGAELSFNYPDANVYHYPDYAEKLTALALIPMKTMDTEDECKPKPPATPAAETVLQATRDWFETAATDWSGRAVAFVKRYQVGASPARAGIE